MTHTSTLPPLDALTAVLAAAETGSFSGAAEKLDLTHGAVSRRVASVERWAGMRLFARHGRGVRLTLDGQRLISQVEQAIVLIEDARSLRARPEIEVVRIGVVQSFARLWLLPHLAALEGEPPDLRVEPEIDHRHMTLSDARIAIRLGPGGWPGVVSESLFAEVLFPVAAPAVAERLGADPDPQALLAVPLIHDATDENWRLYLSRAGLAYERRPQDRNFPGHDLALLSAANGHGIALARDPYGRAYRNSLDLVAISNRGLANPQSFHLVTAPGLRSSAVDRLIGRIRGIAEQPG